MKRISTAVVAVAVSLLAACGTGGEGAPASSPSPTPSVATGTVAGTVEVELDFTGNWQAGNNAQHGTCLVAPGYQDLVDGAQVAVLDASGAVIGVGALVSTGLELIDGGDALNEAYCGFTFRVEDVPKGSGFYGLEIASRDALRYPEAEAFAPLELTLGTIPTVLT